MNRLLGEQDIKQGVKQTVDHILTDHDFNESVISIACVMNAAFLFYNDIVNELARRGHNNVECLFLVKGLPLPKPKASKLYVVDTLLDTGSTAASIEKRYEQEQPNLKLEFLFLCKKKCQKFTISSSTHCVYNVQTCFLYGYGMDDGTTMGRNYDSIFTDDDIYEE